MAFVVQSEPSPREAMESVLRRTTYILVPFSLLLVRYFPAYGREYGRWFGEEQWIGVALQKNSLARLCIMAIFFIIWSQVKRRQGKNPPVWRYQTYVEIFVLVIAFWLLGGPGRDIFYAATAIYALCAGLLAFIGFHLAKKSRINMRAGVLMTILAVIITIGIISIFTGASNAGLLASVAGRSATLTGRTEVWAMLLPIVMQRPIVGGGFGSFWTSRTMEATFGVNEAHNGYLDVLLGLGFIGILLVSMFLLSSCRKAHRELAHDFDWGVLWICFLIIAVVHNTAESSIHSLTYYMTAIILFLTVSSANVYSSKAQI